jgi:hypothetical protein
MGAEGDREVGKCNITHKGAEGGSQTRYPLAIQRKPKEWIDPDGNVDVRVSIEYAASALGTTRAAFPPRGKSLTPDW